jgi:hypothetical protein
LPGSAGQSRWICVQTPSLPRWKTKADSLAWKLLLEPMIALSPLTSTL